MEMLPDFKNLGEFKAWLAANAYPPVLKHGDSFQITKMKLVGAGKELNEVKGEGQALQWLQQLAARGDPILSVSGDLERRVRYPSLLKP